MGCESSTVVEVRTHPAPQPEIVEVVEEEVIVIEESPPVEIRIIEATFGPPRFRGNKRVDEYIVDRYREGVREFFADI